MVEPAALEHRVGEPVGGWVVVRYLEHVEHPVASHEDGLAAVAWTGTEHHRRLRPMVFS
jgi:hypothetical protein